MNRIFIEKEFIDGESRLITGQTHHHLSRVLRTRPGAFYKAVCGDGLEYRIEITQCRRDSTGFRILDKVERDLEIPMDIRVYLGITKGKSFEEILPAMVYLGVKQVIPLIPGRSVTGAEKMESARKQRIKKIIQRATALCGRTRLMDVGDMENPESAFAATLQDLKLLFWEGERAVPFKTVLSGLLNAETGGISLVFGPEGGFTPDEVELARENRFVICSMGPRIFDALTAPVAAVSAVLYQIEAI